MDEVSSTYTREEVAALVEESRGEGLLQADEYDRLAGALGFTERTVAAVLMPPETLTTVRRDATVAEVEDVCAATGYSRFPVTGATTAEPDPSATCTSRTCWSPTRSAATADRGELDPPVRAVRASDSLHDALEILQRRGVHMATVVDDEGRVPRPGDARGRHRGAGRRDPRRRPPRRVRPGDGVRAG